MLAAGRAGRGGGALGATAGPLALARVGSEGLAVGGAGGEATGLLVKAELGVAGTVLAGSPALLSSSSSDQTSSSSSSWGSENEMH